MADSKPYASLSSGLLARKGGAKPAMRPQGFNNFGGSFEDLGWNDMGQVEEELPHHVPSPVGLTPAPRSHLHAAPPVQQVPLEDEAFEEAPGDGHAFDDASHQARPFEEQAFEDTSFEDQSFEEPSFEEPAFEEIAPAASPVARSPIPPPPVVEQQRALRESFAQAEPVSLPRRRAAPSSVKPKAAFTLRLDPDRHLKLRLASAVTRMSAQQLVTGALDDFLNSLPELDALADRLPAEAGQRRR
jgi:hypothetical protein